MDENQGSEPVETKPEESAPVESAPVETAPAPIEPQHVGIDKIEAAVQFLGKTYTTVRDALKDGFQAYDTLALLPVIGAAFPVAQSIPEILKQGKDVDSVEARTILKDTLVAFDIPAHNADDLKKFLEIVLGVIELGERTIVLFKSQA